MKLKGRTALITGASNGIGNAIARRLAEDGANIAIVDLVNVEAAAADLAKLGVKTLGIKCDVSSETDTAAAVEQCVAQLGGIDILVNNAAMTAPGRPFEEIPIAEWRRMLDINIIGPNLLCRAVSPHMRAKKYGRIINVASDTVHLGVPYMLHYVSSKGALIAFTRAIAREFGKDGVNVNAIAPGFTLSERIAKQKDRVEGFRKANLNQLAIQRDEVPEDLAGIASFLASEDCAFMTGQTIVVDGGYAMV
ncbi:MAG: SDR family NAD(P)-dependent oxidoreductase [Burkholderiales bacterium]